MKRESVCWLTVGELSESVAIDGELADALVNPEVGESRWLYKCVFRNGVLTLVDAEYDIDIPFDDMESDPVHVLRVEEEARVSVIGSVESDRLLVVRYS